jgi:sensor histidine kinase YesM
MSVINIIFELVINLLQGVVFVTFCYKFLTPSRTKTVSIIGSVITVLAMFSTITLLNYIYLSFAYIETVMFMVIMFSYCFLFLKGKWYIKIFLPTILYITYSLISFGFGYFLSSVVKCNFTALLTTDTVYRYFYVIIVNMIYLIILVFIYKFFKNKLYMSKKKDMALTFIMTVLSLAGTLLTFAICSNEDTSEIDRLILGIVSIIILSFTFLNFSLIKSFANNYEMEKSNLLLEKEKETYKAEFENSENFINEISMIKHNIGNQVLCINELINNKNYDEAQEMCREITNIFTSTTRIYKTGNIYLDSILNVLHKKAKSKDIDITISCSNNLNFLLYEDMVILLGNLVDNAIEYLENEQYKKLNIKIANKGSYSIIEISNYISSSVLQINPSLATSKEDIRNHGYGISTVRNIVNKYSGDILFYEKDNYFIAKIMFNLPTTP